MLKKIEVILSLALLMASIVSVIHGNIPLANYLVFLGAALELGELGARKD